jgi:(p)ppGpp synthase/HD superfamily hydrolase
MEFEFKQNQDIKISQDNEKQNIEKIQPEIDLFLEHVNSIFTVEKASEVVKALNLMLALHVDQEDRPDNKPYILHPLEVATDLIKRFKIKDHEVIISALLHDSVEDQKNKLAAMYREKQEEFDENENVKNNIIEEMALLEIEELFGSRVKKNLLLLTNPDFNNFGDKNDQYKRHIKEIIQDSDAFIIKFADFSRNALSVSNIPNEERKSMLIKKYGPVIIDVFLPAMKTIVPEHPLYGIKDELVKEMEDVYRKYYIKN